ncbi:hypothetical protein V7S43_002572 [Phytophthora oleae]|uniref:Amino acid transporter transmembrane domain-containing protein n=1 Tax=Phytophthora oleae TaxID=2107226 RepID=A0ABD3G202_9STRA
MRLKIGDQPSVFKGDAIQKLVLTQDGHSESCKFRRRLCVAKMFKQVGMLLSFHVLNFLLAGYGVLWVVIFLASFVLLPLWMAFALCFRAGMLTEERLYPGRLLRGIIYIVLTALYVASLFSVYTVYGQYIYVVAVVDIWGVIIRNLVRMDSRLTNFVSRVVSFDSYDGDLDPDECASHFLIEPVDVVPICPLTRMTRRLWVAALYFLVVKVVIAALGAATLFLVVIFPVLAICSGGEAPPFANQETFGGNSISYAVVLVFSWLVGAVGLPMVAKLSTKVTMNFCGEWKSEQHQVSVQENSASSVDNSTPLGEASSISFKNLEAAKPGSSAYMKDLART